VNGRRTQPLPPEWRKLRALVLERDGWSCRWADDDGRCGAYANEVDHIDGADNHHPSNLRALCTYHHARRTSQQAHAARWAKYSTKRVERHPGLR